MSEQTGSTSDHCVVGGGGGAGVPQPVLWCRPIWLGRHTLAVLWAAMIVYGSLLPFQFRLPSQVSGGAVSFIIDLLSSPRWGQQMASDVSSLGRSNWTNDLVLNLLVYVPLGMIVFAAWQERTASRIKSSVIAVVSIFVMSWLIECMQSLTPGRDASLRDVVMNVSGGTLGVIVAPLAYRAFCNAAYWCYRQIAPTAHRVAGIIDRIRRHPAVMFLLVAVNSALILGWYVMSTPAVMPKLHHATTWLPFGNHIQRSYDVSAMYIGRSIIIYTLIGTLCSLMLLRKEHRRAMSWLVLTMTLLAATVEGIRTVMQHNRPDITEPLIAIVVFGLMMTAGFVFIHAVRCSCRRRVQMPVGQDRRSRPHDYRFAVSPSSSPGKLSS